MIKRFASALSSFGLSLLMFVATAPFAAGAIPTTSMEVDQDVLLDGSFTTFGYNNATTINYVQIKDFWTSALTDTFVPQWDYTLQFQVTDYDGVDTLSFIPKIYFNTTTLSGTETPAEADAKQKTTFDGVLGTNLDGNSFVLESFTTATTDYKIRKGTISLDTDTTWKLGGVYKDVSYDGYTATFEISFSPSKVANYNYMGNWAVAVEVTDNNKTPADVYFEYITGLNMSWYGEIGVSQATLGFGSVDITKSYEDNAADIKDVVFVSNGGFASQVAFEPTWQSMDYQPGSTFYLEAYLDSTGTLDGNQEFAIVIDDDSTLDTTGKVFAAGYIQSISNTSVKTSESGVLRSYYFWLDTSTEFQNSTYTGEVLVAIGYYNPMPE